ncbi:MAG: ABC transporter ATP-binding protein/permease [Bryobacteraceae bacterium]|nr:ABC transporter ATP-binding protein/permease [Bryobacteraceae bacterium]MDW8378622.1 ABC transporter ATP-binding protein [Bryobacterales bacterium]
MAAPTLDLTPLSTTQDELVVRILLLAAKSTGLETTPLQATEAVRLATRCNHYKNLQSIITAAGEQCGLHFYSVRRTLGQVAAAVHRRAIWIHLRPDGPSWRGLVILEARPGGLIVERLDGLEQEAFVRLKDLEVEIEANGDVTEWLAVEAAAPLSDAHRHAQKEEHPYHGVSPLVRLRGWLKAERTDLWVAVVYSIAIGILSLVVPIAVQSVVNTIAFGTLLQPLVILVLIVLVGLGFSTVLQAFRTYVIEIIQRRILVRVSTDAVYRLLRARPEAYDHHHGPELVNRFLEVVTVQKSGAMLLIDGLSIFMQMVVGMVLLAVYHPFLLAYDVFLLVAIFVVIFPMGSGAIATSIKESKAKYALVAWLEELARFPITFKSKRGADYAVERTDALVGEYLDYRGRHFRILLRQIVGSLALQAIASSVLLGVGGFLVINRQLTLGQLIAAELIVTVVVSGFSKFGKQLETFYDLAAAVDKLGYLTDLPLEKSGPDPLPARTTPASLHLRNVSFAYGRKTVLQEVNWHVPAGKRVALIGTGKSTFFDVIYGLREMQSGIIEVDGCDTREIRKIDLRSQIVLVREPEIFHGSVVDNLRLASTDITSAELRQVLESIGLLDEIQSLPEGLNTELQTGGAPLSPGQAMRLMIARAALAHPRILILDECLDTIDSPKHRKEILDFLFHEHHNWTLLVATRDQDILRRCDEVYSLHDGKLDLVTR